CIRASFRPWLAYIRFAMYWKTCTARYPGRTKSKRSRTVLRLIDGTDGTCAEAQEATTAATTSAVRRKTHLLSPARHSQPHAGARGQRWRRRATPAAATEALNREITGCAAAPPWRGSHLHLPA